MTADGIVVRQAELGDGRAIARVRAEARRAAYRAFVPAEKLDDPAVEAADARWYESGLGVQREGRRIDVAERAGEVVGYCASTSVGASGWSGGWIFDLFVSPGAWREGIGAALLDSAVSFLRRAGCAEAALFVFEKNERARAFYEALGWSGDGHREMSDEDGQVVLRYRVDLREAAR